MTDKGTPVGRRVVLGVLGLGTVGVAFGSGLADVTSSVLPGGGWRYYTVTGTPAVRTRSSYRLTVGGLVRRPATLTMDDLAALPRTSLTADFQCVTGWRIGGVGWSGVRVADLLAHVGLAPGAGAVRFVSYDGVYTDSLTLEQARLPTVLVADGMNGGGISQDHGGPVRLLVAPMYGYKSVKWLGGIEVTKSATRGYWEDFGYDADAWVGRSNGRHDAPTT